MHRNTLANRANNPAAGKGTDTKRSDVGACVVLGKGPAREGEVVGIDECGVAPFVALDCSAETSETYAPPMVIRGAKCHVTGRVDWWAGTSPDTHGLEDVTLVLAECFGPWRVERGRNFYAERREFNNGATINHTPIGMSGNDGFMVELPGSALGALAWLDALSLLRSLSLGMRCSRIDLALDYRGEDVPLIGLATLAARQGELCRCKRWKPVEEYSGTERIAYGINFGRRGKDGSGRYMRWYDKGLVTKEVPEGQWVRLEAELPGSVAAQASVEVLKADDPIACLAGMTLGCVDFLENTGDPEEVARFEDMWKALKQSRKGKGLKPASE